MSWLLFLLCCVLTVTWGEENSTDQNVATATASLPSESSAVTSAPNRTEQTSHPTTVHPSSARTAKTPAAPGDHSPNHLLDSKHCLPILMVTAGLIIACAILLISTFMLAWKVCHLSGRVKALASSENLISSTDFWTGKSDKAKAKVETEDMEDTVLLGELDQKQSDAKGGSVTANGDGKKKQEEKEEEEKEVKAEGSLAAAAEESSLSTKPQEDASTRPPTEHEVAATGD